MSARLNLPNTLTWIRIILIPLIVLAYYLPLYWAFIPAHWAGPVAAIIFSLAGITDWLDGYFARKLNQASAFGAFLDPVADKLMISTALVLLVSQHPDWYVALPAAIIIGREIAVSALREWMSEMGGREHVKGLGDREVQDHGPDHRADHDALGAQAVVSSRCSRSGTRSCWPRRS
jgi:CDP-diacylglycerol---glycerol-3-phosphate 3-phosphatidyltransferase